MRSMCYDEIMAARKRKIWSRFSGLVNTASFLCEQLEEQRRLVAEEEEEESRRKILSHFPRKLRLSLKEPNRIDINHIPSDSESRQSYLQWLPSNSQMEALQNPSSDESVSLPSLVEYNTTDDESEKTKMEDPINPNLQSELSSTVNTSRKRRLVEQNKHVSGVKNPDVVSSEQAQREKPEWLVQMMENMNGELTDAKLIFEKCLFVTDVNRTQSRLSMPYNGVLQKDFLTDAEVEIIEQDITESKKTGVEAILVNQKCEEQKVKLKRWEMKRNKVNGSWNYSLVGGWNAFVTANKLKAGDNISVWSFSCSGVRYFALEKTS